MLAAIRADIGIVIIHAQTTRLATPHLTAESLLVDPTPMMAPVIVCVVETGMPRNETIMIEIAPPVSAQNPPTGLSFVIFDPMVLTILHPPESVPSAIAACAERITQIGI